MLLADNHVKVPDELGRDEANYVHARIGVLKVHIHVLKCAFTVLRATVASQVRVETPVTTHSREAFNMFRRAIALIALVAGSFALSACSDVTGPDTTAQDCGGVYAGTGTRACE